MAARAAAKVVPIRGTGTHFKSRLKAAGKPRRTGMKMRHDEDPATVLWNKIGDIHSIQVLNNNVLYAIYERPKVTAGGIHLTDTTSGEDEFQGKAGMILKIGAMVNDEADLRGFNLEPGMWIAVRPSDGWALQLNGTMCRLINEELIRLVIPTPDTVW